jgi:hypothetical protein
MGHTRLLWISGCSLALGLLFTGCAKDDDPADDNGDDTTGTGDDAADDDVASMSMSASESMTSMTTMDDTGTMSVSDSGSDDVSTFEDDGTTEGPTPQPNGAMCPTGDDTECESGHCFESPLGNICGECELDEHCADTTMGGCSIPNPLMMPPTGATCNDGSLGGGCMTSDVCMDPLICAEILNVPTIIVASTCSECTMDSECMDGDLCNPSYDVLNLSGSKTCVPPGSVPTGEGCDYMGSGDEACLSGFCAVADVMGFVQLGVCSECEEDMGCMGDEECLPPEVALDEGLIAGVCMVPK